MKTDLNLQRAERDWPQVVVASGAQTGIVLARNLVRRGLRVSIVDFDPTRPAFKTVYAKAYLCPNPDHHPAEWARYMVELSKELGGRPVIIPSSDQFVTAIAQHSEELSPFFIFLETSAATQDLLATKKRQYEVAAAHGLPVPKTRFVRSLEEVRNFAAEARFPCLFKPVHFREWERFPAGHPLLNQKVAVADSKEELETKYRLVESVTSELVIQEVIEGPDTAKLVYLSCYGRSGERLASCMVRELRTDPIGFGSASVVEPIDDPETDALCDRFLRGIGYCGLCEIELKRDTRDGLRQDD